MTQSHSVYDFQLADKDYLSQKIKKFEGVIIAFLPYPNSVASHLQLKSFKSKYNKIKSSGWEVIFISTISQDKLNEISNDLDLPFKLISDKQLEISTNFEVIGNNSLLEPPQPRRKVFMLNQNLDIIENCDEISPVHYIDELIDQINGKP